MLLTWPTRPRFAATEGVLVQPHRWPSWPTADERTRQALAVAALAGRWAISGPPSPVPSYLDAAATRVAEMAGRQFAVLTSSGSSAIVLALQALGIGHGCRVLVPATTWVGCATAVLRVGAIPVFVDASECSPCPKAGIDRTCLEPVDAVLAIHLYATQVDILALREALPGVPIVEDCSHAHGALTGNGRPIGSLGDLSIFSFQATKLLPAGEGGAVVTDDAAMAARLMALATDSRRVVRPAAPGALNCLEPAHLLHGANHAMSEFAGAALWTQLLRLPELAARRADGLLRLAKRLDPSAGRLVFDEISAVSGGFYGIPLLPCRPWPDGPEQAIRAVWASCGAQLDRVYPPIPLSPLYRPRTVSTYRDWQTSGTNDAADLPNSTRWYREGIVLPHPLFLADESDLTPLAEAIHHAASHDRTPSRAALRPKRNQEVCVVVVTASRRAALSDALRSIGQQTYTGARSVLLLHDCQDGSAGRVAHLVEAAGLPNSIPIRNLSLTLGAGASPADTFSRVALLRATALNYVTTPLVAFLDDDNAWEPDHLESLAELMADTRCLAAHSWRRLARLNGEPCALESFPWIADPDLAARRFDLLTDAGVFGPGSDIVRDQASLPIDGIDYGMVDMGEWLFQRQLFDVVRFDTSWTADELVNGVGEDDKLLRRLRELLIPVSCSQRATLHYRLGGFSNPVPAVAPVASVTRRGGADV